MTNGCFDRAPFAKGLWVFDGYKDEMRLFPKRKWIAHRFKDGDDCQATKLGEPYVDAGCVRDGINCKHRMTT